MLSRLFTASQVTTNELAERDKKRIKQIKFILQERMRPDLLQINLKRLDVIAGRQLVNVMETKKGAVYMLPRNFSVSDTFETHTLH